MSKPRPTNAWQADRQTLQAYGRVLVAVLTLMAIAWFGAVVFEKVDPREIIKYVETHWKPLKIFPFMGFWSVAFHPSAWRYYLAPIAAMAGVFLGAGLFVKDVYNLPRLREAMLYIFCSMTGFDYPMLMIEAGQKKLIKGKTNLIDVIGGPGPVNVQPGNVVMFRHLRRPSNITLNANYFLEPFETIGHIANLDDQHGQKDGVTAMTRDGIKVTIKDFHFRYRIFPESLNGKPIRRSLNDPYPFDESALWNMTYNLAVDERGQESWRDSVGRIITGGVTDFISSHDVDYLTSPRASNQDPRQEMRNNLFYGGPRIGLRNLGAELLWVDIGHFEIDEQSVDDARMDLWAAEWLGRAGVKIEEGRNWREMMRERGRAEGQAMLVASIADALKNAEQNNDPAGNMRRILLMKTAQVIDTVRESGRNQETKA